MPKTEKIRKSPLESATKFSIGNIKKGNDENMWENYCDFFGHASLAKDNETAKNQAANWIRDNM